MSKKNTFKLAGSLLVIVLIALAIFLSGNYSLFKADSFFQVAGDFQPMNIASDYFLQSGNEGLKVRQNLELFDGDESNFFQAGDEMLHEFGKSDRVRLDPPLYYDNFKWENDSNHDYRNLDLIDIDKPYSLSTEGLQLEKEIQQKTPSCDNDPCTNKVLHVSNIGSDIKGDGTVSNPYKTIEKAVSKANKGHTIKLEKGEHLILDQDFSNKELYFLGDSDSKTTLVVSKKSNVKERGTFFKAKNSAFLFKNLSLKIKRDLPDGFWSNVPETCLVFEDSSFSFINVNFDEWYCDRPMTSFNSSYILKNLVVGKDLKNKAFDFHRPHQLIASYGSIGIIEGIEIFNGYDPIKKNKYGTHIDHVIDVLPFDQPVHSNYRVNPKVYPNNPNKLIIRYNHLKVKYGAYNDGIRIRPSYTGKDQFFIYNNKIYRDAVSQDGLSTGISILQSSSKKGVLTSLDTLAIQDNNISHFSTGIHFNVIQGANKFTVNNNTITENKEYGIGIHRFDYGSISNNNIYNNKKADLSIKDYKGSNLDFRNNYWGVSDASSVRIERGHSSANVLLKPVSAKKIVR